jgi:molybdate transport system substrate-binding protein
MSIQSLTIPQRGETWGVLAQRLMVLSILLVMTGCGGGDDNTAESVELTVAAASDLQIAFTEIGEIFEEETRHTVTFSFGSTGNLTTQIENGAPFDVFAAANVAFVDRLIEGNFLDPETKRLYGVGRIVLANSVASGADARRLEDLLDPDIVHVAIANPEHAPYGLAAKEALESAGLWEDLQPKLVYGENIRQALQFIETGNAEVGIVALSIAEVDTITYTLIDDDTHNPLLQAMGVVSASPHQDAAMEFVEFVTGPTGRDILEKYGFSPPDSP